MRVQKDYMHSLSVSNAVKLIVNRKVAPVKSLIARIAAVTHIQFDSVYVLNENEMDCVDSGALRNIITKYWTAKYGGKTPTSSTVDSYITAVKEYLETATRMVGRFLCIKRCQDQWNLDNNDFGQIGQLFCLPQDTNIGELQSLLAGGQAYRSIEQKTNAPLVGTDTAFGDFTQPANAISSASWTRRFTTPLKNVYLPIDVLTMLNVIFAGTIELSSDDDETIRYVQFWQTAEGKGQFPDTSKGEGSVANFLTKYDADYTQIQTLMSEYPMLQDMFDAMDYVPAIDYVNTRRDLSGQTLHVIRDNGDRLEYAIKSVLLAQEDMQNNTDILNNSIIVETKQPYLEEVIMTTPFNATLEKLYNLENFLRGKISVICVSMLSAAHAGGALNVVREISTHCGDNISVYSDARSNASYSRLILASEDSVTEADALTSCIHHRLAIASNDLITVQSSLVESSSKVYIASEGDISDLLFCVTSGFYIDQPKAMAALTKSTLYEVSAGVSNYVTFGDVKRDNNKPNRSNKNKDSKDKKQSSSNKGNEKPAEETKAKDMAEAKTAE